MLQYLEINQTCEHNGTTLKAVKVPNYNCDGCYFHNELDVFCKVSKCRSVERKDAKNCIFVEVNKNV